MACAWHVQVALDASQGELSVTSTGFVELRLDHLIVRPRKEPMFNALADDVAKTFEEESFETGMRRAAMVYDSHDTDGDQALDFDEFCANLA